MVVEGIDQNPTTVTKIDNNKGKEEDKDNNEGKSTYIISDLAGNTLKISFKGLDKKKLDEFKISSMQYNDDPPIRPPENKFKVKYLDEEKEPSTIKEQQFELDKLKVTIKYDHNKNQSTITIKQDESKKTEEIRNGLIFLQLFTKEGKLDYSY